MLQAHFLGTKNCLSTQYFLTAQINYALKLPWWMRERTPAAEAQAREAGTDAPEAARDSLHACLMALEEIRQAITEPAARVQIAPASPDTEGGEE